MKTKFKKLILASAFFLCLALVAACSATTIISIEFVETPKEVYLITEGQTVTAKIKITYSDNQTREIELRNAGGFGINVTGETFNAVGEYTLIVSYGSMSLTFDYRVVENAEDGLFAGGKGTENDPYLIENAVQLSNIRYKLDAYFELTKDIDLAGVEWIPIGRVSYEYISQQSVRINIEEAFTGSLDGKNHSIKNLTITKASQLPEAALFVATDGTDTKYAEIKNLNLQVDIRTTGAAASLVHTAYYLNVLNVHVTGTLEGAGIGGLLTVAWRVTVLNSSTALTYIFNKDLDATTVFYMLGGGIAAQCIGYSDDIFVINNCNVNVLSITYTGNNQRTDAKAYIGMYVGQRSSGKLKIDNVEVGYHPNPIVNENLGNASSFSN